ncbi:replication protein [Yersinia frederiksenii]|uniref:replication regulatory protein RepA n=1 Tax=Yersinia TaxID=629 RepID=UPI0005DF9CF5|nr:MULTISPECIES: replication regulatory protein RepA [Yersinia]EKN3637380.1 replication regulatory protein RepA [Yersinia enterocolitica]CNI75735.1 replication protein [Yersinia frederiksenii]ELI8125131.1 replication regulatory protein RepA [Yersinia enterocolitica]ELI8280739.1 replication regulatory protein RepA [Yersinia enterocolitica]MCB5314374.1 replication regulatory protein RepA [Yersinia intermedia]
MSQVGNAVTSSSNGKRIYRKGHPMSASERQQSFVARKRETHKEIKVLVPNALKNKFQEMCNASGLSQAELFSRLIEKAE